MSIELITFYEMSRYWDEKSSSKLSGTVDPITFDPPLVGAFSIALTHIGKRDATYADFVHDPSGNLLITPEFRVANAMVLVKSDRYPAAARMIGPDSAMVWHGTSEEYGPIHSLQLYVVADDFIDVSALLTVYWYEKPFEKVPMTKVEGPARQLPSF